MRLRVPVAALCVASLIGTSAVALASSTVPTTDIRRGQPSNTIFFHPDGAGLSHWDAARMRWVGPDGALHWDRMPEMAVYRGHMLERLTGTSNGGATVHAFGYKVQGAGSFGQDGDRDEARSINALSGFNGSILREAQHRGHPVGLVNDGNIGEPGTGAFAAEVGNRGNWNAIAEQIINGRPGMNDPDIQVILGGGERNFLPVGTPPCDADAADTLSQDGIDTYPLDCMVHTWDWSKPVTDGRRAATPDQSPEVGNLLEQARERGYLVIRTRGEFAQVLERMEREPRWTPKILGLFAAHHVYNDRDEGDLINSGFVSVSPHPFTESDLVLWGTPDPVDPGFDPPLPQEKMAAAIELLQRHRTQQGRPYFLVAEPESTDNMGNNNNAAGQLAALRAADEMIRLAVAADGRPRAQRTTVLVGADSDASGMQVRSVGPGNVGGDNVNNQSGLPNVTNPLDGVRGRATAPFTARPDQFGREMQFGIAWAGRTDYAGGVLARAAGQNAGLLRDFSVRFDNTDVYRFLYASLFGTALPPSTTLAPDRTETG